MKPGGQWSPQVCCSYDVAMQLAIDTVDLSSQSAGKDLEAALQSTGFVQLVGHGIDQELGRSMLDVSGQFFAHDASVKAKFEHDDPAANRGYRAKGSEALSYSLGEPSPPDLFESFNSGPEGETPWPDAIVPGFSTAALSYFEACAELSARLDRLIGELIGAPWLSARSGLGPDMLATIRYQPGPDGDEPVVEGQQRMGAHSDYSTFTLLDADPVPGLQIVRPDGEWVDVIPEPGALLMNVGDLLAILTNDTWPSTLHRVVPMSKGAAPVRRSLAFFHYPNLDVEIETLPAYITPDRPRTYGSVIVEDHLLDKFVSPKDKVRSTGTTTTSGRQI